MGQRVVLVDDEPRNLAFLEACLLELKLDIECFSDGRVALAAIVADPPDLVLLDMMMPGFDGIDVLTHLRSTPELSTLPVIIVTAFGAREQRLRGLEAGADEFLEKPVDAAVLQARVRTLLRLKSQHDELIRSNQELRRVQRSQRELLAFIAHDLKSPLTAVFVALEYGAQRALNTDPSAHGMLGDGLIAANRVRAMVEELHTVSLLDEARMPMCGESLVLGPLLEVAVQPLGRLAAERGLAITVAVAGEPTVHGDRAILLRVIQNLLDHALRTTPLDGRIAIEADDGGEADDLVGILVSSTGVISPADRPRLFDRFDRDPYGRGGTGLGFYFCRRALEAHHGDIRLVDRPGWPTTFEIRLPRAPVAPKAYGADGDGDGGDGEAAPASAAGATGGRGAGGAPPSPRT